MEHLVDQVAERQEHQHQVAILELEQLQPVQVLVDIQLTTCQVSQDRSIKVEIHVMNLAAAAAVATAVAVVEIMPAVAVDLHVATRYVSPIGTPQLVAAQTLVELSMPQLQRTVLHQHVHLPLQIQRVGLLSLLPLELIVGGKYLQLSRISITSLLAAVAAVDPMVVPVEPAAEHSSVISNQFQLTKLFR